MQRQAAPGRTTAGGARAASALARQAVAQPLPPRSAAPATLRSSCACGGGCPACAGPVSQPGDRAEVEADRSAATALASPPARALPAGRATAPAGQGGRPLPAPLRAEFGARFGADLAPLRLHDDAAAQDRSASLGARAYSQGGDIHVGRGEWAPATPRGRLLLAHEIAHTLQPSQQRRVMRKTLTDLPQATRLALQVSRTAPAPAELATWVKNYFDPASGTSATPGLPVDYGAEITDTQQQKGLAGVAAELLAVSHVVVTPATATEPEQRTNTDPENWPLGPNTVLDLALDLRAQGGEHAVFRFVRYSDGGAEKLLVEKTRVIAAAGSTAGTAAAVTGTHTGSIAVGKIHIDIAASFGDTRGKAIEDAVALLPETLRAKADGLHFTDGGSGQGPGGENGHYDSTADSVALYGDLFAASPRQVGAGDNTAYQIVHEIGHAVDLRPLFAAQRARDAAIAAKKKLEAPQPIDVNNLDPLAGLGEDKPDPQRQAQIATLQKEIDAQNAAMASARSIAGSEVGSATESMLTEFAKALAADGVTAVKDAKKRNAAAEAANAANPQGPQQPSERTLSLAGSVSRYAATDLMEAYAEAYALYVLDEPLLKALRPKTHAFFVKTQPKTAPAAKP